MSDRMIKSLYRTIEMKEALIKQFKSRIAELEAMLAAKDEALFEIHRDAVWGDTPVAHNADVDLYKALALTPADAVEAAKNNDALINKMLAALRYYNTFFGTDPAAIYAFEAIEAARSAGVGVKDVAL